MSATDNKSTALGYMAFAILKEFVSDKPSYTANGFSNLQSAFREACTQAGADPKDVLVHASAALCEQQPGFQERLEHRVSAVNSLPPLH
jgi:hypothetical protein